MCGLAILKRRAAQETLSEALKKEQDLWTSGQVLHEEDILKLVNVTDCQQAKRKEFADWAKEQDTVVKS